MDYGIDVSHYQTVTNWHAVRGNNITFCSIKLSEGVEWLDKAAWHHIDGCDATGIAPGGYHFARPGDVSAQVEHFAGLLQHHRLLFAGRMWPMLDMEDSSIANPDGFIAQFVRELRAATGAPGVLVYANVSWFTDRLNPWWAREDVLLWAAHYNGQPGKPDYAHPRLVLHQHTNEGTVPGIDGYVDRNATVGSWGVGAFIIGHSGDPASAPPESSPTPGVPTHTVRPGDTLSEIAARYGGTVQSIADASGVADPDMIYPGQTLTIPKDGGVQT